MDHRTWINMNSRELLETREMKNVVKTVTLDQVTITVSNAEQQLNTDIWDDELNADSYSTHTEVGSQPYQKPKKRCGKGSFALLKKSKQLGCVFQD